MIRCIHLYTGSDGRSHVERLDVPLDTMQSAKVVHFEETAAGSALDWHVAPHEQYIITLSRDARVHNAGRRNLHSAAGRRLAGIRHDGVRAPLAPDRRSTLASPVRRTGRHGERGHGPDAVRTRHGHCSGDVKRLQAAAPAPPGTPSRRHQRRGRRTRRKRRSWWSGGHEEEGAGGRFKNAAGAGSRRGAPKWRSTGRKNCAIWVRRSGRGDR